MIALTGIVLGALMIIVVFAMLLTRRLREKYAALWLLIGVVILVLGIFPGLLNALTALVGVVLPANLLFALAILLLLGVTLHLSWEQSQAENELRRAAEELAILRADNEALAARVSALEDARTGDASRTASDD
ncbi:MAG: DUF2304 domain-containing protein [Microbacterium sp.]|jgi:hypothetical protein|nr:DUF2304 domain-containing protein [Microbacterium sp.]